MSGRPTDGTRRRGPLVAAVAVGVGLVLAPVAFDMFTAAPLGGQMIEDFRPFMDPESLATFDRHLDAIGASADELHRDVVPHLEAAADASGEGFADRFAATATFVDRWPDIEAEMSAMLDDIAANLDNFRAVDALPPFELFPWFFVVPGLLTVGLAAVALRTGGAAGRRATVGLALIGIGLVAAPAVFGMFARAPQGGQMIDELRPLMTRQQVTAVQGHFVTLGAAEGELRTQVLPAIAETGSDPERLAPALTAFLDAWPTIAADMAPMVGAMGDNLDSFAALDALPPFALFPWFFVAPGILLVGFAAGSRPRLPDARPAGRTGGHGTTGQPERETASIEPEGTT